MNMSLELDIFPLMGTGEVLIFSGSVLSAG